MKQKIPTLYVVTRSTQKFRIGGSDNPTVGLFTTNDRGESWQHWGWQYNKCFSVAIEPGSGGEVLYLACGNGVHKSNDAGKRWVVTTDWQMTECLKVAIDPSDDQTVYAATAYGIFKTTDGGKTWQEKNHGFESTFTPTVIVDRDTSSIVYAATEAGVCRSDDRAASWQLLGLEGKGIRTIVQSQNLTNNLYVGTEDDGVFISTDKGKSWQPASVGLESLTVYALAIDPNNEKRLFAGTYQGGVFKSNDGGTSWHNCNSGLTNLDIHAIVVDPTDSNIVYCGTMGAGVFLSEDGGAHWRFIGLETSQVWDLVFKM